MLSGSTCYSRDNKQIRLLWALSGQVLNGSKDRDPTACMEICCRVWPPSVWALFFLCWIPVHCIAACVHWLLYFCLYLREASCSVSPVAIHWDVEDKNWIAPLPPWDFFQLLLHHPPSPLTSFRPAVSKNWLLCSWSQLSQREQSCASVESVSQTRELFRGDAWISH